MRKFTVGLMVSLFILLSILPLNALATEPTNEPFKLFVNGQQVPIESRIVNNCLYLPVKPYAMALGVVDTNIIWNATDQTVTVSKDGDTIVFKVNSFVCINNGNQVTMLHCPLIIDGSMYTPIAYLAETLNYQFNIDLGTRSVIVNINPQIQEFISIDNEVKSIVGQMDFLLAQDKITREEVETMGNKVNATGDKIELWGELYHYTSIKNMYYDTLKNGLSACCFKMFVDDPEFDLTRSSSQKTYESFYRKYDSNKNRLEAERIRLQKLNYL
jgi:hypothetical protein